MDILKKILRLHINVPTKILYGPSGSGKSYSSFYVRHNLIGKTDEELKVKLKQIITDESLSKTEIELANSIMLNLEK